MSPRWNSRVVLCCLLACSPAQAPGAASNASAISRDTVIPGPLAGEWASEGAEFRGAGIQSGAALYLELDGTGAFISGPPPIGMRLRARFEAASGLLIATWLDDDGEPAGEAKFKYDAATASLRSLDEEEGPLLLKRRQPSVPDAIRQMICDPRC